MYDVIVVGTRVAGASTAMLLARRGLKVLGVERPLSERHAVHPSGAGARCRSAQALGLVMTYVAAPADEFGAFRADPEGSVLR